MVKKSSEPFFWAIFSAGGVATALLAPVHLLLFGLAFPLGWVEAPSYESLRDLIAHPITQLYVFVLCSLGLFHWAHRFRHTLYDAFQIKHLGGLVATLCYGTALVGTVVAAYLVLSLS